MHVSFNIGGQFFAGELIALALLPLLLFDRFYFHRQVIKSQQWLWRFTTVLLLGLLLTSIGYVLSDYYRNNPPSDYLRGWARLFFLFVDILTFALIISMRLANLWIIVCGYCSFGLLFLLLQGISLSDWKFGYSVPITLGCVTVLCVFSQLTVHLRGIFLIGLGLLNIYMDYRSLGSFCVVVAMIGWINHWSQRGSARIIQSTVLGVIALSLIGVVYYASQGSFDQRRQASNSIRLSSAMVAFSAVLESPLIGYGSWGRDTRFAKLYADVQFRMNKSQENPLYDSDLISKASIPAHSQILEAWIEGGILGLSFFLVYFFILIRGIWALANSREPFQLSPLLCFLMIWGLWALFMSPFKGLTRYDIAMSCIAAITAIRLSRKMSINGAQ